MIVYFWTLLNNTLWVASGNKINAARLVEKITWLHFFELSKNVRVWRPIAAVLIYPPVSMGIEVSLLQTRT